jgi:hypothetical protein
MEIVNSLRLIRDKGSDDTALGDLIHHHPARAVRIAAHEILQKLPTSQRGETAIHD